MNPKAPPSSPPWSSPPPAPSCLGLVIAVLSAALAFAVASFGERGAERDAVALGADGAPGEQVAALAARQAGAPLTAARSTTPARTSTREDCRCRWSRPLACRRVCDRPVVGTLGALTPSRPAVRPRRPSP